MGIENPNIGQILNASLDGEPEIRAAGDVLTRDFEKSLNLIGLTQENQVELNPPNPSSLFPLINQRLTDVGDVESLINSGQIDSLVNNPSFQTHIHEQVRMVETLRTFDTFGGTPVNPVPFEEFEVISAIANTDQGPIVAGAIMHKSTRIAYLFNQNDTYDSAYIQFPEGSELGFAKQTIEGDGGLKFSRIVPIVKFDDAPTEVITTDYMDALDGETTNPPSYYMQDLGDVQEIATVITTEITQPTEDLSDTYSVEIQPTEAVASTDQLSTFKQPLEIPPTEPAGGVELVKIPTPDGEPPAYQLLTPEGPVNVVMQNKYVGEADPSNGNNKKQYINPELGVYKTFSVDKDPGTEAYHISGVITKVEEDVLELPTVHDPSVIVEVPITRIQLAVQIDSNRTIFLNGNLYTVSQDFNLGISPDNNGTYTANWMDIKTNLLPGMNVIGTASYPMPSNQLEEIYKNAGLECGEYCWMAQAFENYHVQDLQILEQIANNNFDGLVDGQEVNFIPNGFISTILYQKSH